MEVEQGEFKDKLNCIQGGYMLYNKLGKTDISISYMALGCWALISDLTWGKQDENDSIATKVSSTPMKKDVVKNACEKSLKRL